MKRRAWAIALALPALVSCAALQRAHVNWWEARRDSSAQAPDPAVVREAVSGA